MNGKINIVDFMYTKETNDLDEFINNNGYKYGKFIMLQNYAKRRSSSDMDLHYIYNIHTRQCSYSDKYVIRDRAFKNSLFNWTNKSIKHIWFGMIARCYNPNKYHYEYYGGKGIKVCREWYNPNENTTYENWIEKENFKNFCLENNFINGMQIDRYDSDGDYCPENCQIVSPLYNHKFNKGSVIIHINFANIIEIYDTLETWEKFINNTVTHGLRQHIGYIAHNEYGYGRTMTDVTDNKRILNNDLNIKLEIYFKAIINNLPISFIDFIENELIRLGYTNEFIPVYYDSRKPYYQEWLNSYRIS